MQKDHVLWKLCSDIQNHFSLMGGSNRYVGFDNFHIPAVLLIVILEHNAPMREAKQLRSLLPAVLWMNHAVVIEKASQAIKHFDAFDSFVIERFLTHFSKKFKNSKLLSNKWEVFLRQVKELGWL